MNVAADLKKVVVFIDQKGLIALLKYMPCAPVSPVKIDCVTALKSLHQFGKVPPGRLDEKMDMVRYKAIAQEVDLLCSAVTKKLL